MNIQATPVVITDTSRPGRCPLTPANRARAQEGSIQAWKETLAKTLGAISLGLLAACAGEERFERVEDFPTGPQVSRATSAPLDRVHTSHVSDRYAAPYEIVWAATKKVVGRVEQTGIRPTASFDEEQGLILLTQDHRKDEVKPTENPDAPRLNDWQDQFRIEVIKLSSDRTKVIVSRKVLGVSSDRPCADRTSVCRSRIDYEREASNGRIESWILTQIEDAVTQPR